MNRRSDGFSDSSYEELLNQYAGESVGAKPKAEEPKKAPTTPAYEEPVFNIDIKRKKQPEIKRNVDVNLIAPFEDKPKKAQPVIEKRYDPIAPEKKVKSTTMKFKKRTVAEKTAPEKPQQKPQIIKKGNGKKAKIDFKAIPAFVVSTVKNNKRTFIGFGCCLLASVILSTIALSCLNDVFAMNRTDDTPVEVVLPNDATTFKAVRVLDKEGLIKNSLFCTLYLKIMGYGDEDYLPGVYYFTEDMGVEKMITRFKTSTTRGALVSVTIPEGYTIDQIFERLEKNDVCTKEALYKTIDNVDFSAEYKFLENLTEAENRYHVIEGYMFPATYEFEQGADPATVIRQFLDAFKARWTEEYDEQAKKLGMTVDEIITIASIVEKEGANADQFKLVSSVLHNRLNRSGIYPTLECNSTQDYVTNTVAKRVTKGPELSEYIRNYSTYESEGLPPGAICNPGAAAIEAALYPDSHSYYFFAHDNNRKIYMASTMDEHTANLRAINKANAEVD